MYCSNLISLHKYTYLRYWSDKILYIHKRCIVFETHIIRYITYSISYTHTREKAIILFILNNTTLYSISEPERALCK